MNEFVWGVGGIVLTGECRSTRVKTCSDETVSNTNLRHTGLVSNTGLRGERKAAGNISQLL
jgi:hypothetical protein